MTVVHGAGRAVRTRTGVTRARPGAWWLIAGLLVLTAAFVVERVRTPSDGTVVQISNAPWRGDRIPLTTVLDETTGLRANDAVVGLDGHPLPAAPSTSVARLGDDVTYSIVRDGSLQDVAVRLREFPLGRFLVVTWPMFVTLTVLLVIGLFVLRQRPDDRGARVLAVTAALLVCGTTGWLLGGQPYRLAAGGAAPLQVAGEVVLAAAFGGCLHFALVVPGSTLRVSRALVVALYALPFALHAAYLIVALPAAAGAAEAVGRLTQVSYLASSTLPPVVAVALLLSYRSMTDRRSRTQMRWVLVAFLVGGFGFVLLWTIPTLSGESIAPEHVLPIALLPPTVALGAAILRYGLFDVEILLRRSLVYGLLTAGVLATYLVGAWFLSLVPGITPAATALVVSGLVAAVAPAFSSWLRRRVGRLVFGGRHDPFEVVAELGRIDAASDPRRVLQDVVDTLARTLRLSSVAIELRSVERQVTLSARSGDPDGPTTTMPLGEDGRLGRLVMAVRHGHEPFGPADRQLLEALADEVAGAASTILLTTELQASRERIVTAREDERRRIHHRLHDGLGPSLAAGVMQLEVVARLVEADPDRARAVLDAQIQVTRELVRDVRGIVLGLRPPSLDQLGLVEALRSRTRALVPVDADGRARPIVRVDGTGDLQHLPAAVEVAVFWIVVEAVSNTVRHAGATHCRVQLARDDDLRLRIEDDGRGLPPDVVPGGGLVSMRERAEELGGTCRIRRGPVAGTVVDVVMPIHRTGDST